MSMTALSDNKVRKTDGFVRAAFIILILLIVASLCLFGFTDEPKSKIFQLELTAILCTLLISGIAYYSEARRAFDISRTILGNMESVENLDRRIEVIFLVLAQTFFIFMLLSLVSACYFLFESSKAAYTGISTDYFIYLGLLTLSALFFVLFDLCALCSYLDGWAPFDAQRRKLATNKAERRSKAAEDDASKHPNPRGLQERRQAERRQQCRRHADTLEHTWMETAWIEADRRRAERREAAITLFCADLPLFIGMAVTLIFALFGFETDGNVPVFLFVGGAVLMQMVLTNLIFVAIKARVFFVFDDYDGSGLRKRLIEAFRRFSGSMPNECGEGESR